MITIVFEWPFSCLASFKCILYSVIKLSYTFLLDITIAYIRQAVIFDTNICSNIKFL
jgi:hypothetical protein